MPQDIDVFMARERSGDDGARVVLIASVLQSPVPLCRIAANDAAVSSLLELLQEEEDHSQPSPTPLPVIPNSQHTQLTVKKLSLEILLLVCVSPRVQPATVQVSADSRRRQVFTEVLDLLEATENSKFVDLLLKFLLALKEKKDEDDERERLWSRMATQWALARLILDKRDKRGEQTTNALHALVKKISKESAHSPVTMQSA